jgi:hypothetical protein
MRHRRPALSAVVATAGLTLLVLIDAMFAFGLRGPRREPRGVAAPVRRRVAHCARHDANVIERAGTFPCSVEASRPHYVCPSCEQDIGQSAVPTCPWCSASIRSGR